MSGSLRSLYICYLSLEDPLVHTQVVAYLEGLAARGHTVRLLTFDMPMSRHRRNEFAARLRARGIAWHSLRYHKRPSLPATVYDTLAGAVVAARIVRRHRLDAVHARNHVPAAMALLVRRATGCRLIFDVRGLMADEYADAGRWRRGGIPFRLTEWIQRVALRRADAVAMLTEAVRPHLLAERGARNAAYVIPCCVDLERVAAARRERGATREEVGAGDRAVMVYLGKFTGWYMEREMADFFVVARRTWPALMFLILTQADPGPMLRELRRNGIGESDYRILHAPPEEVGRYLAAADFGISFVRPCFSKVSSSPTKIGEYLAAGLPIVSSAGIGDVDDLLSGAGVLVHDFGRAGYERATAELTALLEDPSAPERCREIAHRRLSLRDVGIPRYDALYRQVAVS